MAYYIIYFDDNNIVIDVIKYSESEYDDYLYRLELDIEQQLNIQYGHF